MTEYTREQLESMKWGELQKLARELGIHARKKKDIIEAILSGNVDSGPKEKTVKYKRGEKFKVPKGYRVVETFVAVDGTITLKLRKE